ncbi:MAG: hypothetical protein ABSG79_07645 [Bryobacteraceae bacterium]
MSQKPPAWLMVVGIAAVCGVSVGGVAWYRARSLTTASLLRRIPAEDALVAYIDFSELRRGGILQLLDGSKAGEDPEYRSFVRQTQFDYKKDLDAAIVAFAPTGRFLLLKGRFDWKSLRAYVESQNGKCANSFCRMTGSTLERRISFFPLRSNLMALAVSPDDSAALRLESAVSGPDPQVPAAPVWLSIPTSVLKSSDSLPEGTRMFASGMERAETVTLAFAPEGRGLAARLDVRCRDERDAADLAAQLTRTTSLLREMMEREHRKPDPADLSGVLTSGAFRNDGRRVLGYWPIERAFVQNVLGGS